jgi:hypothetical protein
MTLSKDQYSHRINSYSRFWEDLMELLVELPLHRARVHEIYSGKGILQLAHRPIRDAEL